MNLRNIPNIRFEKIIMAYALLYIILYPITSKIIVLKRMELFLVVPFCMAIFNIVYNKKNLRRVFVSIIICYSFLKSILLFSTDYRYVPYTNILIETLKGSKYNYNQRSEFNHKNSPYEK